MRIRTWLAAPLASVVFVAGCTTCPTAPCDVPVVPACAPVQTVTVVQPGSAGEKPVATATVNAAPLREAKTVAVVRTSARARTVPTIPAMPLPEGWDYIGEHEVESADAIPLEKLDRKYFSTAPTPPESDS